MRKFMPFLVFLISFTACKESANNADIQGEEAPFFSIDSLPDRVTLQPRALEITREWKTFNELDIGFNALSTVENNEDLVLVMDDLVDRQKRLEDGEYPEQFDIPQVRSRQKVMKTFIFKTRAAAEYRIDATPAAIEMMKAYNALRTEFNVLVNNTLDTLLINDE